MALPTFVGVGTPDGSTGTITPGLPTGWAADDLFLLVVNSNSQHPATAPAGWTEITGSPLNTSGTGNATGEAAFAVFYRIAQAGDTAPTVADSGNHTIGYILAWRGVDTTTPLHKIATNVVTPASTSVTFPSVTTTLADCLIVNLVSTGVDTVTSQVSGWANASLSSVTEREDHWDTPGQGGGVGAADGGLAAAGSSGATTATLATSATQALVTLALAAAAAGGASYTETVALTATATPTLPSELHDEVDAPALTATASPVLSTELRDDVDSLTAAANAPPSLPSELRIDVETVAATAVASPSFSGEAAEFPETVAATATTTPALTSELRIDVETIAADAVASPSLASEAVDFPESVSLTAAATPSLTSELRSDVETVTADAVATPTLPVEDYVPAGSPGVYVESVALTALAAPSLSGDAFGAPLDGNTSFEPPATVNSVFNGSTPPTASIVDGISESRDAGGNYGRSLVVAALATNNNQLTRRLSSDQREATVRFVFKVDALPPSNSELIRFSTSSGSLRIFVDNQGGVFPQIGATQYPVTHTIEPGIWYTLSANVFTNTTTWSMSYAFGDDLFNSGPTSQLTGQTARDIEDIGLGPRRIDHTVYFDSFRWSNTIHGLILEDRPQFTDPETLTAYPIQVTPRLISEVVQSDAELLGTAAALAGGSLPSERVAHTEHFKLATAVNAVATPTLLEAGVYLEAVPGLTASAIPSLAGEAVSATFAETVSLTATASGREQVGYIDGPLNLLATLLGEERATDVVRLDLALNTSFGLTETTSTTRSGWGPDCIWAGGGQMHVAVCPTDDQIVLTCGDTAGLSRSTDGGNTWRTLNGSFGSSSDLQGASIEWHPNGRDVFYLVGGTAAGSLWYSADAGLTWTDVTTAQPTIYGCGNGKGNFPSNSHPRSTGRLIAVDPTNSYIYVGTYKDGVWRAQLSDVSGTWTRIGLAPSGGNNYYSRCLIFGELADGTPDYDVLYLGTSTDASSSLSGHAWRITSPRAASPTFTELTASPVNPDRLAAYKLQLLAGCSTGADKGLFVLTGAKTAGAAKAWVSLYAPGSTGFINHLERAPGCIWIGLGTPGTGSFNAPLVKATTSDDFATAANATFTAKPASASNVSDQIPGFGHFWLYEGDNTRILGGKNFFVSGIAVSKQNPNRIIISCPGVWRTTDGGTSWQPIVNGIENIGGRAIACDPYIAGRVYMVNTDRQLYRSNDGFKTNLTVDKPGSASMGTDVKFDVWTKTVNQMKATGARVYVAICDRDTNTGGAIYYNDDPFGASPWVNTNAPCSLRPVAIQPVYDGSQVILLAAFHSPTNEAAAGIYRRVGSTWTKVANGGSKLLWNWSSKSGSMDWKPGHTAVYFFDKASGSVWRGDNYGATWTQILDLNSSASDDDGLGYVACNPNDKDVVYYSASGQLKAITNPRTATPSTVTTRDVKGTVSNPGALRILADGTILVHDRASSTSKAKLWQFSASTPGGGGVTLPPGVPETSRWIYEMMANSTINGCVIGIGPNKSKFASARTFSGRKFYYTDDYGSLQSPFNPTGKDASGTQVETAYTPWDDMIADQAGTGSIGYAIDITPNIVGNRSQDATFPGHAAVAAWVYGDNGYVDKCVTAWANIMLAVERRTIVRFWHEMSTGPMAPIRSGETWADVVASQRKILKRLRQLGAVAPNKCVVAWCTTSHPKNPGYDAQQFPGTYPTEPGGVDIISRDNYIDSFTTWEDAAQLWYDHYNPINGDLNPDHVPMMTSESGIDSADPNRIAKLNALRSNLKGKWSGISAWIWWDGAGNDLIDTPAGFQQAWQDFVNDPYFLPDNLLSTSGGTGEGAKTRVDDSYYQDLALFVTGIDVAADGSIFISTDGAGQARTNAGSTLTTTLETTRLDATARPSLAGEVYAQASGGSTFAESVSLIARATPLIPTARFRTRIGKQADGTSLRPVARNKAAASRIVVPSGGEIVSLHARLANSGATAIPVRATAYRALGSGEPGALLVSSPAVSIPGSGGGGGAASKPATILVSGDFTSGARGDIDTLIATYAKRMFVTVGDHGYPDGTNSDFASFDSEMGSVIDSRCYPTPGSHDYGNWGTAGSTVNGMTGYIPYFTGKGVSVRESASTGLYKADAIPADDGTATKWRLIRLDAVKDLRSGATDLIEPMGNPTARQYVWLKQQLQDAAAKGEMCLIAYAHPRFTSKATGHHSSETRCKPIWDLIDAYNPGKCVVVSGHQHNYERFDKQLADGTASPNGTIEFVVGIGGGGGYVRDSALANSLAYSDTAHGVLELVLTDTGFTHRVVNTDGTIFDSGSKTL